MSQYFLPLALLLAGLLSYVTPKTEVCITVSQEDCESFTTEYEKYRECMERRTKRSASCDYDEDEDYDSCDDCDCTSKAYSSRCNSCCESSCNSYSCCRRTCRADCRSSSCRTSCKRKCYVESKEVKEKETKEVKEVREKDTKVENRDSTNLAQHNVTTIIHLNNIINTTNNIDIPVVLNQTNYQGGSTQLIGGSSNVETVEGSSGVQDQTKCCRIVGPRQCVPLKTFPFIRCFHIRKKACGDVCQAPVVHFQQHEICDSSSSNDVALQPQPQSCRQQVIYVPQPQPRCGYSQSWPYVSCGNQQYQSCEGCYGSDTTGCSPFCYDDGYGSGPLYRQGPYYRQGFAPSPSCYQTGTCGQTGFSYPNQGFNFPEGAPVNPGVNLPGYNFGGGSYPGNSYGGNANYVIEEAGGSGTEAAPWGKVSEANGEEIVWNPYFGWVNFNKENKAGAPSMVSLNAQVDTPISENQAQIIVLNKGTTTTEKSEASSK